MTLNRMKPILAAGATAFGALTLSLSSCVPYQQPGVGGSGSGTPPSLMPRDPYQPYYLQPGDQGPPNTAQTHTDRPGEVAPPPPPAERPKPPKYPKGFKTDHPHQVISPYKPHNVIDISENPKTGKPFNSGDYVRDSSNGKIFQLP